MSTTIVRLLLLITVLNGQIEVDGKPGQPTIITVTKLSDTITVDPKKCPDTCERIFNILPTQVLSISFSAAQASTRIRIGNATTDEPITTETILYAGSDNCRGNGRVIPKVAPRLTVVQGKPRPGEKAFDITYNYNICDAVTSSTAVTVNPISTVLEPTSPANGTGAGRGGGGGSGTQATNNSLVTGLSVAVAILVFILLLMAIFFLRRRYRNAQGREKTTEGETNQAYSPTTCSTTNGFEHAYEECMPSPYEQAADFQTSSGAKPGMVDNILYNATTGVHMTRANFKQERETTHEIKDNILYKM